MPQCVPMMGYAPSTTATSRDRAAATSTLQLQRLDLYQTIVEYRRPAKISEGIAAGKLVGVFAVARQFLPPHRQRYHDSAPRSIGDPRAQLQGAAIIEHPHIAIGSDAARRGIVGLDIEPGLALGCAQTR